MTRNYSNELQVIPIRTSYKRTLNTLEQWSTSSNLAFNPTKCKVETISRKRSKLIKTCYTMDDLQLEHCSHERDLGVWISTDLTWKKQVEAQSGKANKILGYVKRTSNSIKSIDTKRTIYLYYRSCTSRIFLAGMGPPNCRQHQEH